MTTVNIKPQLLKSALIQERARAARALKPAALAAARRFTRHLVQLTDSTGKTDRGIFKNSWRYAATEQGATTWNDAPYAGVIELGARPHPVSQEGRELIEQWAIRKLGVDPADAKRVAFAICQKIKREGQAPTYMVRDALPQAREFFAEEFARIMGKNQSRGRSR